jgi:hypothetical protein
MVHSIVGQQTAQDLRIGIFQDEFVDYEGPAAALVAEGLIPEDFTWPRAAASRIWNANGFRYWLQRRRPQGHKGPMRSWLELDNWSLRVKPEGLSYWQTNLLQLKRQEREIQQRRWFLYGEGKVEWERRFDRFLAAERDKRFQAFKALVPGLVPPKRGRKPKAAQ